MTVWRRWAYLRALLRVGRYTSTALLWAAMMLGPAVIGLYLALAWLADRPATAAKLLFGCCFGIVGIACLAWAFLVPYRYFGCRPGSDPVWEWPSDIVRREEQERQEARRGIELIAGEPPEGTGTELESGTAPEGRGTELAAGGVTDGQASSSDVGGERRAEHRERA